MKHRNRKPLSSPGDRLPPEMNRLHRPAPRKPAAPLTPEEQAQQEADEVRARECRQIIANAEAELIAIMDRRQQRRRKQR